MADIKHDHAPYDGLCRICSFKTDECPHARQEKGTKEGPDEKDGSSSPRVDEEPSGYCREDVGDGVEPCHKDRVTADPTCFQKDVWCVV